MNNVVVKIEKSGNRFNAWDSMGKNGLPKSVQALERRLIMPVWRLKSVKVKVVEPIGGKFQ